MKLRPYQESAVAAVEQCWANGAQSVLLVLPTGAGKTLLGQTLVGQRRTLWAAPRRELVAQAAERLRRAFGRENVGVIMRGAIEQPSSRIQVGTVQTLLNRQLPDPDLIVLDEAHHFIAEKWRLLFAAHPQSLVLGLTATPERDKGEPLGDIFQQMVVGASYSELLGLGHLVPARVYQPERDLGSDIAMDAVEAWLQYSEGDLTFAFEPRKDLASALAARFRARGIKADSIRDDTPTALRDSRLARFRAGILRVLTNVYALTEGIDVPELRVILLARSFDFVGGYIQTVGRALRAAEGKRDAIIIDLCGATIRHGLPGQDRIYSLSGRAITVADGAPREVERAPFSRSLIGAEMKLVAPGALPPNTEPLPVLTAASAAAERNRQISDQITRRQGRAAGEAAAAMLEKMSS